MNKTYYRMFTEMTKDPGREGPGWNKYGKMTRKEAGGIRAFGQDNHLAGPWS